MSLAATTRALEPAAFDALAETYDDIFTESGVGRTQRTAVLRVMDEHFRASQQILEINCGTGVDAVHLAKQGARVVACDISAKMIALARRRLAREGLESMVEFRVLPTERLRILQGDGPFDGALSNFAGLNCVEDLSRVSSDLARLLKPGAKFVACVFSRWCFWEILWYLGQVDRR